VSLAVRNLLRYPDILGLEEVENLSTLQAVAAQINGDAVAAGDPNPGYVAYLEEGNDVGGIDVGFLVKTSRINVVDVTQVGKDTTYINPNNGQPELLNDRPSLVLRAEVPRVSGSGSVPVTVIVNHLRSLSGIDDPADGNRVRTKRRAQAEFLASYVQSRQVANPAEKLILVGDFNAFQFNDGYVDVMGTIKGTPTPADEVTLASPDLVDPDFTDLFAIMPEEEQYSYSFDGNAQILDHALVNGNLLAVTSTAQYVRVDADFPESFRNDPTRPERLSDHDPVLVTFDLPRPTTTTVTSAPNPSAFGETVTFFARVSVGVLKGDSGTVTFFDGDTAISGPIPVVGKLGMATFQTSALAPGTHTITAAYSGVANFDPSSGSVEHVVLATVTVTTLGSAPNPSGFGQPVTFTATVSGAGGPVTQGTVSFREGATPLAGPIALDAGGHASFTTSSLSVGVHAVTADFSGADGFDPSSAGAVQTVAAGLSIGDVVGKEGTGAGTTTFTFVVHLTPAAAVPVTVDVATADGTAQAGSDYAAVSTTVTFPPGATQQAVSVVVSHDSLYEPDETFFVRLTNPSQATVVDGEGVGTILNDDELPTLRVNDVVVKEGNSGTTAVSFLVKLSTASSLPVTVSYATVDRTATAGSDYDAVSGSLSFPPGTTSLPVVVNVNGDLVREPNEIFFLQLTSVTNATIVYGRGIGVITNDDAAPTVTMFFPKHGPVGKVVTVYGSGFAGATAVTFGGASATFEVVTDGRLKATVPAGAVTGPIGVMTVNGPAEPATGLPDFIVDP
jgi:endonuclease/exonuclease/phosphatase family metal-dependent hydrolase